MSFSCKISCNYFFSFSNVLSIFSLINFTLRIKFNVWWQAFLSFHSNIKFLEISYINNMEFWLRIHKLNIPFQGNSFKRSEFLFGLSLEFLEKKSLTSVLQKFYQHCDSVKVFLYVCNSKRTTMFLNMLSQKL